MTQSLENATIIITGASSGIGAATAVRLAGAGANVVLAARRGDRLDALAERIAGDSNTGTVMAAPCDVTSREAVLDLVARAIERFSRVDGLINNAGVMPNAPMAACRMDEWDRMVDINIKGVLHGIGAVLPGMLEQKSGHILNVSSVAGRHVFPGAAVYCATKHAVHAISEGLRAELAERSAKDGNRIRVTIIAPGVVDTELWDTIKEPGARKRSQKYFDSIAEPLTSEDVAEAIHFAVASPEHVGINEVLMRPRAQPR